MRSYPPAGTLPCALSRVGEAMRESGPTTVGAALAEFLQDCELAGKAPNTITAYRYKLRARLDLAMPLAAFDRAYCRAVVITETRTKAAGTARTFRGALSSFCSWGVERGCWPVSPLDGTKAPKVPEGPPRALPALALQRLWEAAAELDRTADAAYSSDRVTVPRRLLLSPRKDARVHQGKSTDTDDTRLHRSGADHPSSELGRPGASFCDGNSDRENPACPESTDSEAAPKDGCCAGPHGPSMPSHAVGRILARTASDPAGTVDLTAGLSHGGSQSVNTHRLLLSLLSAGLRRSEAAAARWQDIDGDTLRVYGKGRKYRRVLLPPEAMAFLVDHRSESGNASIQLQGRGTSSTILGLNSKALYRRFKAIAKKAGLPSVYPHQMRHTFATNLLRKGMSPLALQTLGGWADQRMLARYSRAALEEAALAEARRLLDD